jgi:hypothetical protein
MMVRHVAHFNIPGRKGARESMMATFHEIFTARRPWQTLSRVASIGANVPRGWEALSR